MEREEFMNIAQEILGDRNDDRALEFAKACGELFDTGSEGVAERDARIKELEAENSKIRSEYRDLYFKGKSITENIEKGNPIIPGAQNPEDKTEFGSPMGVTINDLDFGSLFQS